MLAPRHSAASRLKAAAAAGLALVRHGKGSNYAGAQGRLAALSGHGERHDLA